MNDQNLVKYVKRNILKRCAISDKEFKNNDEICIVKYKGVDIKINERFNYVNQRNEKR